MWDSSGKFGFLPVVPHGCFIKVPSDEPVDLLTAEGQTTVYPAGGLIKPFALLVLEIPTLYLPVAANRLLSLILTAPGFEISSILI